ncbi:S-layer homology domain-containing protein [Ruminiclostridium josui]|nr:S-layer homology domain-containing protein [Ruminiclostridium josui]
MDKRFISKRTILIPMLTLVILVSQLTSAFAISSTELTNLVNESNTVAVEIYEPVLSQKVFENFSDVPANAWYFKDVHEARRLGIIAGVGNNKFAPHEDITYAQYLKIISAILDESINNKPDSIPWYDKFIESCRVLGAVDKNEVVPATIAIPRELMIKYTCKALSIQPFEGNEIVFGDVKPEDAAWINAAYNEYLTEGSGRLPNGSKKFGIGEYATRAQLATMALRIKAYHENPTQYKEQAAEAREEADKKWEAENEAKIDAAGVARAEEVFNNSPIYNKKTNHGLKFGNTGYT